MPRKKLSADAGFTEKRNLAFASDDLPDIILRAKISPQEEMKYAANGQLVALDEYLDYAPNLSALIEQDDAIRKGITMPDGHIYSCPQLNKTEGNLIHHYWINKTWLDNLGLEAPTTVDELYDVLVAFRDNDPNGNGQKDEIAEYLLVCFQVEAFRPQPHVPLKYLHRVADGCDKHENQRIQNHYNADCGEAPKHNIERPVSCAQFLFAPFYCRHNPYLLLPTIRTGSYR